MYLNFAFLYITSMKILISNAEKTPMIKAYNRTMVMVKYDKESFPSITTNIKKVILWRNYSEIQRFGRAKADIEDFR